MQEHLFEHFNEEGHHGFLEDVSITFIDKTDPSEPLKKKITGNVFLRQWRLYVSTLKKGFEKRFKESRKACFWTRFIDYDGYFLLITYYNF